MFEKILSYRRLETQKHLVSMGLFCSGFSFCEHVNRLVTAAVFLYSKPLDVLEYKDFLPILCCFLCCLGWLLFWKHYMCHCIALIEKRERKALFKNNWGSFRCWWTRAYLWYLSRYGSYKWFEEPHKFLMCSFFPGKTFVSLT